MYEEGIVIRTMDFWTLCSFVWMYCGGGFHLVTMPLMGEAKSLKVHSWTIKDVSLPRTAMGTGVKGRNLNESKGKSRRYILILGKDRFYLQSGLSWPGRSHGQMLAGLEGRDRPRAHLVMQAQLG